MITRKSALSHLGFIIFALALILGVLLCLVRAIPDLEATMFGFIKFGYPALSSMRCPPLMTTSDRQPVTIKLKNNLDRPLAYSVTAQFSSPVLINSVSDRLELQPGETRVLSWDVSQENINMGSFIFARVFTSAAKAQGMNESLCGTFVMNLPLTGGPVIYFAAIFVTALFIVLGLWLWRRNTLLSEPHLVAQFTWMRFNAVLIVIGVIAGYMDSWFASLLCVFLILLTTVVYLAPRKV